MNSLRPTVVVSTVGKLYTKNAKRFCNNIVYAGVKFGRGDVPFSTSLEEWSPFKLSTGNRVVQSTRLNDGRNARTLRLGLLFCGGSFIQVNYASRLQRQRR